MQPSNLLKYFYGIERYFDKTVLLPLLKRTAGFLERRMETHESSEQNPAEWKQRALDDFNAWLMELPDDLPADRNVDIDSCDLYTLLTEFTALRQEIKLQTREQNRALRHHETFLDGFKEAAALFKERTDDFAGLEERIRLGSEKNALTPFLGVRDALGRGLDAARAAAETKSFFRRPPRGINGVVEGYEMALRRFDRALSHVGVTPLKTVGQPFDPTVMRAMINRTDPQQEPGIVIEELLPGFIRGNEVIRTAEVVVNGNEKQ